MTFEKKRKYFCIKLKNYDHYIDARLICEKSVQNVTQYNVVKIVT
jgi:hypothetical protein